MDTTELRHALSDIFAQANTSYGEYELLSLLSDQKVLQFSEADPDLRLFKRHFVLMNALYCLQQQLLEANRGYLAISPLAIELQLIQCSTDGSLPSSFHSPDRQLREFYSDWDHFHKMKPGDVQELLKRFWEMYASHDGRADALAVLGAPADASMEEVKRCYQSMAALHHPDKGGDEECFRRVREAYETLRRLYA